MKIALLAPPYLSVPPSGYGGTEQIVSYLTEELVRRGHDVTLFASGDSKTRANLVSIYPVALGNDGTKKSDALAPLLHYLECFRQQDAFDIIHSHAQYLTMFFAAFARVPVLHTWHGSYFPGEVPEEKRAVLTHFSKLPIVSISNNQRQAMPGLNYIATVYNGINITDYPFVEKAGQYLLWVGRIVQKKGPLEAIMVAKKLNIPLQIAAAVDPVDKPYFDTVIRPEIDNRLITFHGELSRREVAALYGNALCTLYPITWHEPFGLVMAESMACGTPVIAYNMGSVPEIIHTNETGFVVEASGGVDALAYSVGKLNSIKRLACRKSVEEYFTVKTMVDGYETVYNRMVSERKTSE